MPDFRGLNFDAARAVERDAEVKPADPKPDAPPLSAYWWEHQELIIATQDPAPGAEVYQWDSVAVTLGPPDPPVDAIVRQLPPLTLYEAAVPEKQRAGDD